MSKKRAQWYTPIAYLKNREEVWRSIEDKGWKAEKMDTKKEITYFNTNCKYKSQLEYDLYFAYTKTFPLWDERKSKDNRRYLPDIWENIFEQEKDKSIPVLTSMMYGRPCRPPYDEADHTYKRFSPISDFYRKRGVMNFDGEYERTATD